MASKKCFINIVHSKGRPNEVQWIEVPKLPDGNEFADTIKEELQGPDKVGTPARRLAVLSSWF